VEGENLFMTDKEFDVLDELYFIQSFGDLLLAIGLEDEILVQTLISLFDKGWIRVYHDVDLEVPPKEVNLQEHAIKYFYLASKEGLLAHNTA
jgi:hypothetical protein